MYTLAYITIKNGVKIRDIFHIYKEHMIIRDNSHLNISHSGQIEINMNDKYSIVSLIKKHAISRSHNSVSETQSLQQYTIRISCTECKYQYTGHGMMLQNILFTATWYINNVE